MKPALAKSLQVLAEALPPGTAVPVPRELLLELLAGPLQTSATGPRDLTVADLCTRFERGPSAVRAWLERGDFPGAFKLHGRDWRVPAAAVEAFCANQAAGTSGTAAAGDELGAWRQVRGKRPQGKRARLGAPGALPGPAE
ncbi:MAG: helix-turn-helix transcriptional regulator [Gemmatimonadales bacterium]